MELLNFRCPNCGGSVTFEDNAETATCNFCGATLHFQNEIEKLQKENKGKIDLYTERIVALIQCQKFIQAEKLIEEALLDCPYAGTLYVFRLLCELGLDDPAKLATYGKDYTTSENFKKSVRFLTGQDKEDLLSMAKQNERLLSPATDSTPSQAKQEPDPFKALFEPGSNALSDAISLAVTQKLAEKFADDEDEEEDDDEDDGDDEEAEEPRTYNDENAEVYVKNIKNKSSLNALQKIRKITIYCGVDFVKLMIFNGARPSFVLLPETSPRTPELGEGEDFYDFCLGVFYNLEIDDLMEEVEKNRTAYPSLTEESLEELRLALYIKNNIRWNEERSYDGVITDGDIQRNCFDSEEAYRDAVHRHLLFLYEYLETVVLRLRKIRPEIAFRGSTEDLIRAGKDPVFYEEKFIRPLIVEQTAAIATYTRRIFPGFAVRKPYLWVDTLSPDIFRRECNDIMEEHRAENERKKLEYELGGLGLFNIRRKIEIYRKLNEIKKTNQINRYQTELAAISVRVAMVKDDLAKLEGAPAEEVRQAKEAVDRTPLTAFARRKELKTVYDAKRNAYEEKKNRLDSVLKTQAEKQKTVEKELARTEKSRFLL